MSGYTKRQLDAVEALGVAVERQGSPVTPSSFAVHFWPGKTFARGNGPWGLGPDASGRHGARMLNTLERLGLARVHSHYGYWTAELTNKGREVRSAAVREAVQDE